MKDWNEVRSEEDFYNILENTTKKPQIIFKDSITCGISAHAKERLLESYSLIAGKADFHYVDLIRFRAISNLIAQTLMVTHQSPQIIILKDRRVVYTSSHHAIDPIDIAKHL